jgi:hypothetical protein
MPRRFRLHNQYVDIPGEIYVIHMQEPFYHARHYVGFAEYNIDGSSSLAERIQEHRHGKGSRLLSAVNKAGIAWDVVMVVSGNMLTERFLHKRKHTSEFCPVCSGAHAASLTRYLRRILESTRAVWEGENQDNVEKSILCQNHKRSTST